MKVKSRLKKDLAALFGKYEPLGQWEAGELVLRPADALRFADDIHSLGGVGIVGVDVWYYVPAGLCEDICGLDSSQLWADPDNALELSIRAAKEFISDRLPHHIDLVSFVLTEDETE